MGTLQKRSFSGSGPGYEYKETITDGVTSDPVLLPVLPGGENVTVTLIPSGTARIESTTSLLSEVKADTATWQAWPYGDVSAIINDTLLSSATALRAVSVSGSLIFEISI